MPTTKHSIILFLCLALSAPASLAQTRIANEEDILIVIQQGNVRFSTQRAVTELRLQVFDETGNLIYDSESVSALQLNWQLQDTAGHAVKSGLYAYALSLKATGATEPRVRRGHIIIDRAKERSSNTDKLWVTSQNENGVGVDLTVARDENATVAGAGYENERTAERLAERPEQDAKDSQTATETNEQKALKNGLAASTVGQIPKFTGTNNEVGDSLITEAAGNIGIGSTNPLTRLQVRTATGLYGFTHTDGTTTIGSYVGGSTSGAAGGWLGTQSNHQLHFFTNNGQPSMSVATTGDVGIGTTTPGYKLDVGGNLRAIRSISNDLVVQTSGGTNAWARTWMITPAQRWAIGTAQNFNGNQFYLLDDTFGHVRMTVQPNAGEVSFPSPSSNHIVVQTTGGENSWAQLRMKTTNQTWAMGTSQNFLGDQFYIFDATRNQTRLTIQPNGGVITLPLGNVGIGTTNPTTKLHVEGAGIVETTIKSSNERAILSLSNGLGPSSYVWTLESGVGGNFPSLFGIYNRAVNKSGLEIDGNLLVYVKALQITGGADLSESFDVGETTTSARASAAIQPGMVVTIDPANPGKLRVSRRPYDRRVAGVVSGAGGVKPGVVMGQEGTLADGKRPVALSGRVYVWADATYAGVKPGDLLTTSPIPGHAMKARDSARAQGAIIGKAMTGLKSGRGLVLALVTLQ